MDTRQMSASNRGSVPQDLLLSETKRIQDLAFEVTDRNEQLAKAARRTLRALDGYWAAWEEDGRRMELWWTVYERWRVRLEELSGF